MADWGSVPAWVAAGISTFFGSVSWWSSRKSKKSQAEADRQARRATKAAEDAAEAGTRSANAAERAATVLEEQHRSALARVDAAESVPWRLTHRTGAKWELWNETGTPKYRITISGPGVSSKRNPGVIERIDGRSSFEFWGSTHWGADPRVEATWHLRADGQDEPRTWAGTLPPSG